MNVRQMLKSAKKSLSHSEPSWALLGKGALSRTTPTSMSVSSRQQSWSEMLSKRAVMQDIYSQVGKLHMEVKNQDGSSHRVVSAGLRAAPYSGFQPSPGQQKQNAATGSCSNGMDICGTPKAHLVKGIQELPVKLLGSPKVQKLNILEI